jgi:hypothetical protein
VPVHFVFPMAKFKAAGSSKAAAKKDAKSNLRALPCLVIILAGAALLSFLFFAALTAEK